MLIREIMTPNPVTISPDESIDDAFQTLLKKRFRQAPVVENGKLVGIVTDRDLRMAIFQSYVGSSLNVRDVMRFDPITISADAEVEKAARIICEKKFNALPVVSGIGNLVGIVTTTDILKGILNL